MEEVVPSSVEGERLDRVVALVSGATRSEASRWIEEGRVERNGAVQHSRALRVAAGDVLRIHLVPAPPRPALEPDPEVAVRTVYEDEQVLVVDKAPGCTVHPGDGDERATLAAGLLARYPELAGVGPDPRRPGIVHRLDRDTSGLLVVARTAAAFDDLVDQLRSRGVTRRYVALVWGHPATSSGAIEGSIGRSRRSRTRMAVSESGREARTRYQVRQLFVDPVEVALLECVLETGRTHQIRVHLEALGHPVVGDRTYHGVRQSLVAPRQCLHAEHLAFDHPASGGRLAFDAPMPQDLAEVLAGLG